MAKLVFGLNQSLDGYVDHHRARSASLIARPRRRGDRVRWRREFVGLVAVQPLRKPAIGWANQRS